MQRFRKKQRLGRGVVVVSALPDHEKRQTFLGSTLELLGKFGGL